jgi:hypothetical protein
MDLSSTIDNVPIIIFNHVAITHALDVAVSNITLREFFDGFVVRGKTWLKYHRITLSRLSKDFPFSIIFLSFVLSCGIYYESISLFIR